MRAFQSRLLCSISVLAFCTVATAAYADDVLETVVVTGEKRSENVQRAPVAVTVISGDAMASANVSDFSDIAKFAPTLTFTKGDHPGNSAAIIRGIGTFAFSIAVEPSVLVVIDDVAAGYQAQAFQDLVDVNHVEVMAGPQSTLYGKSASAGLVLITTKTPTSTFTYSGDVKLTNDGEQRLTASLSGPISDTVRFRLNGSYRNYNGNVINLYNNKKIDSDQAFSVSGKVQWVPIDKFEGSISAHFTQDNAICCGYVYTRVDSSPVAPLLFGAAGQTLAVVDPGVVPSPTNRTMAVDQVPTANAVEYGASVHARYDFGSVSLISITALNHYRMHDLTDYDQSTADIMAFKTPCGAPFPNCAQTNSGNTAIASQPTVVHGGIDQGGLFNVQTISQEIRLTSDNESKFTWLVGLYFDSEDVVRNFARGFQTYGQPVVPNTNADTEWRGESQFQNYAIFGQTQWEILPQTTLITGLRLNREHSAYSYVDYYRNVFFPGFTTPAGHTDDVWTGKVGLQYQFTDDIMAFATVSRGYKGVGYNLTSNLSAAEAAQFPVKRETSIDYETGVRTTLLNDHLMLNATAYWMDYNNFQISSLSPTVPNSFILTNIPSVRTRGLEVVSTAAITEDLTASIDYAFTEAYAVSFPVGSCYTGEKLLISAPLTCSASFAYQDQSGQQLPNAPKNKIVANVGYKLSLPGIPLDAAFNINTTWQSSENFGINRDPGTREPAYGITNFNVTLSPKSDKRFSLSFFINNLFDKQYDGNLYNQGATLTYSGIANNSLANNPGVYAHNVPRDVNRYFGIRLAYANE